VWALENPEGLDRKFTLNYYSRARFLTNLLPLLRTASSTPPHFSRTLSILGAGQERKIDFDDLELKSKFSGPRCATHSIVMNSFIAEEFATREPGTTFIHSYPSLVNTGSARELPWLARGVVHMLMPLMRPFTVGADETGARQLFIATSGLYPPAKPVGSSALSAGLAVPKGLSVLKGADGKVGSGGYLVSWNGEITGNQSILKPYHEKGVGKIVWEHTLGIFDRVEKVNRERTDIKRWDQSLFKYFRCCSSLL
jgi:hypothetical protein